MDVLTALGGGTGVMVVAAVSAYRKSRRAQRVAAAAPAPAGGGRAIDPTAYGMAPGDRIDTTKASSDPEGEAARAAALAGDWRTPAAYLEAAGSDWDLRWRRLGYLAEAAAEDDAFVKAWQAARPDDPSAALVHADGMVMLAGKLRGALGAQHTTHEQFDAFHRVLADSEAACLRAAELAPEDPSPYIARITIARGLGWSHERFRTLWAEVVSRAPHHFGAHRAALQYCCAKWQGSHELMHEFARQAAASAPPGDLLAALPLFAVFEQEYRDGNEDIYRLPATAAAVDAAWRVVAAAPAGHHRLPEVRHILANALECSGRYAEAVEQFQLIGPFCGAVPWTYYGSPLKAFGGSRATAVAGWEDAGRPAVPQV
ncbi:hypothetical protein [Kitasatospora sp. DSM 101779]|uniref:hypothetical protein n=1 Tax=Kitasatospora sp. DSM 101779 TaxID=2853165 RepID=UPI0021D9BB33|nr:hypothetical protein [Kitasatospora sp. DSM 101779]MCU7823558.1 hypothetical protein [Kitasatospora sp. DSM 101779]